MCGPPDKTRWEVCREEGSIPGACCVWLTDTEQVFVELALLAPYSAVLHGVVGFSLCI